MRVPKIWGNEGYSILWAILDLSGKCTLAGFLTHCSEGSRTYPKLGANGLRSEINLVRSTRESKH